MRRFFSVAGPVLVLVLACGGGAASFPTPSPEQVSLCAAACDHRVTCGLENAASAPACKTFCGEVGYPVADLTAYTKTSCDEAKGQEPSVQYFALALPGCKRMIECGIPGTPWQCVNELARNQISTANFIDPALDCNTVINGPPPAPAPSYGGGGGSYPGTACMANGTQDCRNFEICCSNGQATTPYGGSGLCVTTAICFFPRG